MTEAEEGSVKTTSEIEEYKAERAAIMEYDGGFTREEAERRAEIEAESYAKS